MSAVANFIDNLDKVDEFAEPILNDATQKVSRGARSEIYDFKVNLGQTTDDSAVEANVDGAAAGRLGMMVRPLSPEEKQQTELSDGLVVEDVERAAAEAGVQPGDIVIAANGTSVKSVEQLRSVVSGSKTHVALLVQRGDARIFLPIELG
jgi:serine protease Do